MIKAFAMIKRCTKSRNEITHSLFDIIYDADASVITMRS